MNRISLSVAQALCRKNLYFTPRYHTVRNVVLKPLPRKELDPELTFFEKNKQLKRPISPHLSIYKIQMTSLLSITHRAAGLVLAVGLVTVSAFGYLQTLLPGSGYDTRSVVEYVKSLQIPPLVGFAIKVTLALPFTYHAANGIRHLVWDSGKMLTNKGVVVSGYVVLLIAVLMSVVVADL